MISVASREEKKRETEANKRKKAGWKHEASLVGMFTQMLCF